MTRCAVDLLVIGKEKQSKITLFCLGEILPVKIRSCSVLVFWEIVCIGMEKYLSFMMACILIAL